MTEPFEFEIEAEPVAASHLLRVRCCGCGVAGAALAAPGQERNARCAPCMGGSVVLDRSALGRYEPVQGDALVRTEVVDASEVVEYPVPRVSSLDDVEGDWPGPVLKLEADARGLGWTTRRAYSRGCFPHGTTGRPLAERDVFSVRFAREAWQGYAIYTGGKWESIFVTGAALLPFGKMGRTELGEWLTCPGRDESWYDAIRERERLAEARKREAAAVRARKGKGKGEGL